MILDELPRVKRLMVLLGLDNGANAVGSAVIPQRWEMRATLAEDELLHLSEEQVETLAQGEQSEAEVIAEKAPNADLLLEAAFDGGELAQIFFEPWQNIFDARDAEARH